MNGRINRQEQPAGPGEPEPEPGSQLDRLGADGYPIYPRVAGGEEISAAPAHEVPEAPQPARPRGRLLDPHIVDPSMVLGDEGPTRGHPEI